MRISSVTIGAYKNLKDLTIAFDVASPYTVFVGQNGAGKSNLLEALTLIFRHLDLDERSPFDYAIEYSCREADLRIEAKTGSYPRFETRDAGTDDNYETLARKRFMLEDDQGPLYRPAFVFGYYSGQSSRMRALYEKHRERYYEWIIRPAGERGKDSARRSAGLRRLFFAENLHGQFALIAFFMESSDAAESGRRFLRDHLQIDGLDSVLFVLRRPPWRRTHGGDERFWKATGDVQQFLERLYEASFFPARMQRRVPLDLTKNPSLEHLYLFLPNTAALEKVYATYGDQYAFFTALESMHLSKVLGEVRTRVRMSPAAGGGQITYRDLSEGEQQLLLVLGLLKFTARKETLFLLDEPDTHLNPQWSTRYLGFLDEFLVGSGGTSHVMINSHDPLVFAGLTRPQVRVFGREADGRATVDVPLQDPRGMGIQAILASELFGLASGGLDQPTLDDLERQHDLASKTTPLTEPEQAELRTLTDRLVELGFWNSDQDPLLQLFREKFVPRWAAVTRELAHEARGTSPEESRTRERVAGEIAAEIASEMAAERS